MTKVLSDEWVVTGTAAVRSSYDPAYIRQLVRKGAIRGQKVGRDWVVHLGDVLAHKREMDALGEQRHNPWRAELVRHGRGRRHDE